MRAKPVAVVTGAGRGLGRAVVELLLERGYRVAGTIRGATGEEGRLRRTLGASAEDLLLPACDLRSADDIDRVTATVLDAWGRIDLLVNNAATGTRGTLVETTPEQWDDVMATNVRGAFLFTRAALETMRRQGGGHVFMVSSLAGAELASTEPLYGLSKAALSDLAALFASEVAEDGIAVVDLVLGAVDTSAHCFPGQRGADEPRWEAVPAREVAEVVFETAQRGTNTHVRRIVLTELRSGRAAPAGEVEASTSSPAPRRIHVRTAGDLRLPLAGSPLPAVAPHADRTAPYFYLDTGNACDLRCPWCSVDKASAAFAPKEQLVRVAREAARHGLGRGMFIGGEPSLHPDLEEIMALGRAAGVPRYGIMTNGSGLVDKARVKTLARLGMDFWQLSIPDHRPEVLRALLGGRDHWETLGSALENIGTIPDSTVVIYQVVLRQNLEALSEAVTHFARLKDRYPRITTVVAALAKPAGETAVDDEYFYGLGEAIPAVRAAIERAEQLGLEYWVAHLPGCLLPERPQYHSMFPITEVYDTVTKQISPQRGLPMWKGADCRRCRLFEVCEGYHSAYVDRWGGELFTPAGELVREMPLEDPGASPSEAVPASGDGQPSSTSGAADPVSDDEQAGGPDDGDGAAEPSALSPELQRLAGDFREAFTLVARRRPELVQGFSLDEVKAADDPERGWSLRVELSDGESRMALDVLPKEATERPFVATERFALCWVAGFPLDTPAKKRLARVALQALERYSRPERDESSD